MLAHRPTALLLALALVAGAGAFAPGGASAMGHGDMAGHGDMVRHGDMAAEAPHACCHGQADPCETPCPTDEGRSPTEAALCCASGEAPLHESAVAPPAPVRLDLDAVPLADWLAVLAVPPAPPRSDGAARHGPRGLPVRSHLAISVLLI